MLMPTVHLIIKGVFFRVTAKEVADELGVTGWVKNMSDGNVEAVASGTEDQLQQFIQWCRKGPRRARVEDVVVEYTKDSRFKHFEVIRK